VAGDFPDHTHRVLMRRDSRPPLGHITQPHRRHSSATLKIQGLALEGRVHRC
jgi:hypothetical protein